MTEGELKKRILILPEYATEKNLRKGIESSIISGLANRAHLTGATIDKAHIMVEDIFKELFENPSTKWQVQAYIGLKILKILDEAKREFPTIEKVGDKLAEQFNAPYSERMLYVAFITEMRTWFKKWFGRAEE